MEEGDREVIERVRLGDVQPGQRVVEVQLSRLFEDIIPAHPDDLVWRAREWMPACPPHVDERQWATVTDQLETIHSLLEETDQEHLGAESVANLMNEAIVGTRKLGVELEVVMSGLHKKK